MFRMYFPIVVFLIVCMFFLYFLFNFFSVFLMISPELELVLLNNLSIWLSIYWVDR